MNKGYQLGISQILPCNYLPEQEERLLIAIDHRLQDAEHYGWLMSQGFRRSGDQIYRPHCLNCSACRSLRVLTKQFVPSKSQKRLIKKNQEFSVKTSEILQQDYYELYERYINTVHNDGSMYPANYHQYQSFLTCELTNQIFVELWHNNKLISVAVTDVLHNALSAVYTFYDPSYKDRGIGVFSILTQIETAREMNREFLYLGYQIDECQKMNYKDRYYPHQILDKNTWITRNK